MERTRAGCERFARPGACVVSPVRRTSLMSELENPRSAGDAAAVTEPPSGSTAPSVPEAPSRPPAPAPSTQSPTEESAAPPEGAARPRIGDTRPAPGVSGRPDAGAASSAPDSNGQGRAGGSTRSRQPRGTERGRTPRPPRTPEEGAVAASDAALVATTIPEDTERAETDGEPGARAAGGGAADVTARARASGATWSASTSSPRHPDRHARGPLARRALRLEGG